MKKIGISENKIIKYLFLIAIISLAVFFLRVFLFGDFVLENNPFGVNETPYFDVSPSTFLIFSPDVPSLYYYSHGLSFILSILVGFLLFRAQKKSKESKLFLGMMSLFCLWLVSDLIQWATEDPILMFFLWGVSVVIEVLFFGIAVLIAKYFSDNTKNLSKMISIISILAGGVILLFPSTFGLIGVDMETYEVIEGVIAKYLVYIYEFLCLIFITHLAFKNRKNFLSKYDNGVNKFFLLSIVLFLVLFLTGNLYGSFSENWAPSQYGLIGMPVLVLLLSYLVQKYNFSNAKVLLAQFSILILLSFTIANLFIRKIENIRIVVIISTVFIAVVGFILVRAVKKEIEQRIHIAKLNIDLQEVIKQRESLVHLVTHKVKGSFTRSKYIFAGLLDGTFGDVNAEVKRRAAQGLESDNTGIQTVDLVLNASNLQKGTVKYDMKVIDFKEVIQSVFADKKVQAEAKGLQMESEIHDDKDDVYSVMGDVFWLKEAVNNLIDNSIKYTRTGKITIGLEDGNGKVRLTVKDTGIGITDEDKKSLFTEGGRGKDSVRINVDSTGYGLYSVKLIMDAHKGKVWAESELGKGSTFYVELDAVV